MNIIEKLPTTFEESLQIILNLQQLLQTTELELKNEQIKNAFLLEQFRLAKQARFAPKSEKNIYQIDLFIDFRKVNFNIRDVEFRIKCFNLRKTK